MADETYKVTITGAGLNLERDVSAKVGEQVVLLVLTGRGGNQPSLPTARVTPPVGSVAQRMPPPGTASTSLREYLDNCEAKRSPDKITAIGQFLKDHRGKKSFTRADLDDLFQEAADPVPKNVPRDLKWTVRVGWIAPKSDDKGAYYVTAKGSEVVGKKFPKDVIKKTSQAPARAKKSTGNKPGNE